jgi:hypothetical protein
MIAIRAMSWHLRDGAIRTAKLQLNWTVSPINAPAPMSALFDYHIFQD